MLTSYNQNNILQMVNPSVSSTNSELECGSNDSSDPLNLVENESMNEVGI